MNRHRFLTALHERLAPRSYLEIGVNDGRGLARSNTRTIGVDPAFKVTVEVQCDLKLVQATSDDFFARPDALDWFPNQIVDLTFIDGLHLFEFALRDFINTERHCNATSVVVFDDMLPRSVDEAARKRQGPGAWTGDVFKVAAVLERYRPDLAVIPINSAPTGLLIVLGLDPANNTLSEHYDEILAEFVTEDPQEVPAHVLDRTMAADPDRVLAWSGWDELLSAREGGRSWPRSRIDVSALRDGSQQPPSRHGQDAAAGVLHRFRASLVGKRRASNT